MNLWSTWKTWKDLRGRPLEMAKNECEICGNEVDGDRQYHDHCIEQRMERVWRMILRDD